MRLGIIGSGAIVQEFLPELAVMNGLEILAIQGTKNNQDTVNGLCEQYQIPHAVFSFEELCKTEIDTVYVAVPNFLHFEYCKKALENGYHVIVEKPVTSNLKEAKILKKLSEEKERFLFEAVTTAYLGNYRKIQEWLPRIGQIKIAQSQYSQYSSRYDAFLEGKVLPAFDPAKSGGALMDLNLYNLHYIMGLFGKPCDAVYTANIERGIDTSGVAVLKYPSFTAVCMAAKDCKGLAGGVIQGTRGCIRSLASPNFVGEVRLELNDGTVEVYDDHGAEKRLLPEFHAFIKAIHGKDRDFCQIMLEKSLAVSEVQTKMRLEAGIRFPADEENVCLQ